MQIWPTCPIRGIEHNINVVVDVTISYMNRCLQTWNEISVLVIVHYLLGTQHSNHWHAWHKQNNFPRGWGGGGGVFGVKELGGQRIGPNP